MSFMKKDKPKGVPGYAHPFQTPVFQPEHQPYFHEDYQSYHNPFGQNRISNPIITNGGYYGPLYSHENEEGSNFGRILLMVAIFVILCLCFVSIIVWMLFGINLPEFEVSSFSVPDFNTTSTTLVGKWDVNITISNPNEKFRARFDHFMTSIYYKDSRLAEARIPDFDLIPKQNTSIRSIMATQESGVPLEANVAAEMQEERAQSSLTFRLRLIGNSTLTTTSTSKKATIKVYCDGLTIDFSNNGVRTTTTTSSDCLLYPASA